MDIETRKLLEKVLFLLNRWPNMSLQPVSKGKSYDLAAEISEHLKKDAT